MLVRLEGHYATREAAGKAAAGAAEEAKPAAQGEAPRPAEQSTPAAGSTGAGSAPVPREAAEALARAGVPLVEAVEAGYGPLLERRQRALRRGLEASARAGREAAREARREGAPGWVAEQAARAAARAYAGEAAGAVREAQREALAAAAVAAGGRGAPGGRVAELRRELQRRIDEAYQRALARAQELLRRLEEQYRSLRDRGATRVAVDTDGDGKPDTVMALDEWYRRERSRIEAYIEELQEWRREALRRLAEEAAEAAVQAALAKLHGLEQRLESYAGAVARAYAAWSREVEQRYQDWLRRALEQARRATSREAAARLAEEAYREALRYWAAAGAPEEVARRYAEEARRRVKEAAEAAAEAYNRLREEANSLYKRYAEAVAALAEAAAGGDTEAYREAMRLVDELRDRILQLAGRLGVPRDVAESLAKSYAEALQETLHATERQARAARELERLYRSYAERLRSLLSAAASTGRLNVAAEAERLLAEFREKALEAARRHGLGADVAEEYVERLRRYVEQGMEEAMRWAEAREAAERLLGEELERLRGRLAWAAGNLEHVLRGFRQRLVEELQRRKLPKEAAERLAEAYVGRLRAEIARAVERAWRQLVPADFICLEAGGGLVCDVYLGGRYATSVTIAGASAEQLRRPSGAVLQALLAAGYRPARLWVARSPEERRRILLAYLRRENPQAYMEELKRGLAEGSVYERARTLVQGIGEFYAIPAERLLEKAQREGGVRGAALGALAEAALFGGAVAAGAAGFWDLPGMAEFGRELASGRLVQEVAQRPLVMVPQLLGQAVGASIALGGLGRAAGRLPVPETVRAAAGEALTAAALGAMAYGALQAKTKMGVVPLFIGAALAKAKKPARARLELLEGRTVELPLEEAVRRIVAGEAEPWLELGGRRYRLAKLRTPAGEQPVFVPEDVLRRALEGGRLDELSRALGREVVLVRPGRVPEIVARATREELTRLWSRAKAELLRELEERPRMLLEELRRTEEQLRDIARELERAETPEQRARLQRMLEEYTRRARELRRRLREEAPQLLRELREAKQRQPRAEYRSEGVGEFLQAEERRLARRTELEEQRRRAEAMIGEFLEWATKQPETPTVEAAAEAAKAATGATAARPRLKTTTRAATRQRAKEVATEPKQAQAKTGIPRPAAATREAPGTRATTQRQRHGPGPEETPREAAAPPLRAEKTTPAPTTIEKPKPTKEQPQIPRWKPPEPQPAPEPRPRATEPKPTEGQPQIPAARPPSPQPPPPPETGAEEHPPQPPEAPEEPKESTVKLPAPPLPGIPRQPRRQPRGAKQRTRTVEEWREQYLLT